MSSSGAEVCAKCGQEITQQEAACVFKGEIVCIECDKKLREEPRIQDRQEEYSQESKISYTHSI
jgi:hypothetical protein